jgi:hypothetical protein
MDFWKHNLGQIQSYVIHEFTNATAGIGWGIKAIEKELAKDHPNLVLISEELENIKSRMKRQQDAIDYGYKKTREFVGDKI